MFQFTRPRGARLRVEERVGHAVQVSIHAPTWGATAGAVPLVEDGVFQFTRPRGARRPSRGRRSRRPCRFNSRAHVGRDRILQTSPRLGTVSIHAPTWGATPERVPRPHLRLVSIHAPTWGATPAEPQPHTTRHVSIHAPTWGATCVVVPSAVCDEFQFTRPRGARPGRHRSACCRTPVSIHAPTWGATLDDEKRYTRDPFQFTRPRGARREFGRMKEREAAFQFTRPRGARPPPARPARRGPRVSIHAPTWGATLYDQFLDEAIRQFQFTRPRGARPLPLALASRFLIRFNSRAHVGRDPRKPK